MINKWHIFQVRNLTSFHTLMIHMYKISVCVYICVCVCVWWKHHSNQEIGDIYSPTPLKVSSCPVVIPLSCPPTARQLLVCYPHISICSFLNVIYISQFSCSVMSEQHHGLQHARLPRPSPTSRACSNSCPSSGWCHPTISSSSPSAPAFNLLHHQGLF